MNRRLNFFFFCDERGEYKLVKIGILIRRSCVVKIDVCTRTHKMNVFELVKIGIT